jgi:peptidoglycan/xylan/chitin deacetylase (PgdA/CDA1 family)
MEGARGVLVDTTGQDASGFRAPYLQVNDDILSAIDEVGFSYDSSMTVDVTKGAAKPWRLSSGLLEVPLAKGADSEGRSIHSYLWAMHEGKRQPEDYLGMMRGREETFLVLATHSWHLVETFSDGMLNDNEIEQGLDQLGSILEGAREAGVEFVTIEEFIRGSDG